MSTKTSGLKEIFGLNGSGLIKAVALMEASSSAWMAAASPSALMAIDSARSRILSEDLTGHRLIGSFRGMVVNRSDAIFFFLRYYVFGDDI